MVKQRVMVYQMKDFDSLKEAVLALDDKYGSFCNTVGLYRRIGKYCIRVDASAEESVLDEMEALLAQHGNFADLNMSQLIRESESMIAETGIDYIKGGGIL